MYADYGFRDISVRRGYYPAAGGREDAILMGLML
jgi:ribosomal-protein-alanine N-acetyltransferase